MTPAPISAILNSRAFQIFARIMLTTPFWAAGLQHALQWQASQGEMVHFGLNPPALYVSLTIAVCLLGSAAVIAGGRWTWLGAGALAVFTALTIPIAHAFWSMSGDAAMSEFRTTIEHLSMIGGLMIVSIMLNGGSKTAAA